MGWQNLLLDADMDRNTAINKLLGIELIKHYQVDVQVQGRSIAA